MTFFFFLNMVSRQKFSVSVTSNRNKEAAVNTLKTILNTIQQKQGATNAVAHGVILQMQ